MAEVIRSKKIIIPVQMAEVIRSKSSSIRTAKTICLKNINGHPFKKIVIHSNG